LICTAPKSKPARFGIRQYRDFYSKRVHDVSGIIGSPQGRSCQRHLPPSSVSLLFLVMKRHDDSPRTWIVSRGESGVSLVGQRNKLFAGLAVSNNSVRRHSKRLRPSTGSISPVKQEGGLVYRAEFSENRVEMAPPNTGELRFQEVYINQHIGNGVLVHCWNVWPDHEILVT